MTSFQSLYSKFFSHGNNTLKDMFYISIWLQFLFNHMTGPEVIESVSYSWTFGQFPFLAIGEENVDMNILTHKFLRASLISSL